MTMLCEKSFIWLPLALFIPFAARSTPRVPLHIVPLYTIASYMNTQYILCIIQVRPEFHGKRPVFVLSLASFLFCIYLLFATYQHCPPHSALYISHTNYHHPLALVASRHPISDIRIRTCTPARPSTPAQPTPQSGGPGTCRGVCPRSAPVHVCMVVT